MCFRLFGSDVGGSLASRCSVLLFEVGCLDGDTGLEDVGEGEAKKGFLVLDSWTACDGHANSVLAIESAQQLSCRRPLVVTLLTRTAK
jgi:hypothetical protein